MSEERDIAAQVLEGTASEAEVARLVQAMRKDPQLRREVARLAALHGQLGVALEGEVGQEHYVGRVMEAVHAIDREDFVEELRSRLLTRRWALRACAAAAVVVLSLGLWWLDHTRNRPGEIMAHLERVENLDWGAGEPRAEGAALRAGALLKFDSGLLELEFAGRGHMVVEGPAHLELPEAGYAVLHAGRVVMRVTPAGHGFRIDTPKGDIIDLGTEFGVAVSEDGTVETHVLQGLVEAVGEDGTRVKLEEDDALRLGPGGGERMEVDAGKFYTRMPPKRSAQVVNHIHWSLDEGRGSLARARASGLGGINSDLIFYTMDEGGHPEWVDGAFNSALTFDGKGGYAESDFKGIEGGKPRTVAFWVKVPEDFSQREGFGLVSWGRFQWRRPGEVWQVAINPLQKDGPVGRLRLGLHQGQIVGSTDLRDGLWHHVAVVLYGGSQPDVGTHALLYVDGKQETVSRRALREVRTEVDQADHGIWLARNVAYTQSTPGHAHGGFFRGGIDEVYVFDAALSGSEIRNLMEHNTPPE